MTCFQINPIHLGFLPTTRETFTIQCIYFAQFQSVPITIARARLSTIAIAMAHSFRVVLRHAHQSVVAVASIPALRTQSHRTDAIVHVTVAEIPMTLARVRLQSERSAKAVVARKQIDAQAKRAHRADALRRQRIAVARLHVQLVALSSVVDVRPNVHRCVRVDRPHRGDREQRQQVDDTNRPMSLKHGDQMDDAESVLPVSSCSLWV